MGIAETTCVKLKRAKTYGYAALLISTKIIRKHRSGETKSEASRRTNIG